MPLGVPSSFQAYDPHPIVVKAARGASMWDVDDNEYVDYDMGFGALFSGHINPVVRRAVDEQLDNGTLFVTPCELNADVAELLGERYGLPMWRFTNSGTEATMDAIRVARGATGRDKIVKVEGGYHGHHDEVMISMKPSLDVAGPADRPNSVPATAGVTRAVLGDTIVIPYNDAEALERVLRNEDVACFIVEPVMENIGICLPDDGYLQAVREITSRYGTLLIFDEVKTGITAGWGGATGALGVSPDLVALAKSPWVECCTLVHTTATRYAWPRQKQSCQRSALLKQQLQLLAETRCWLMPAPTSLKKLVCQHTRCSLVRRAVSRGRQNQFATIAITRRPILILHSLNGFMESIAASCCHRVSMNNG
jgi:4-aminobutyrate aminotransferase-like enzyme